MILNAKSIRQESSTFEPQKVNGAHKHLIIRLFEIRITPASDLYFYLQGVFAIFARPIEGIPAVFPAHIPKLSRLSRNGQSIGKTRKDAEKGSVILHQ